MSDRLPASNVLKAVLLVLLLSLLVLTGCARRYRITFTNNNVTTTTSKPKLNKTKDAFVFKDGAGRVRTVPAGSVKQIEPQSSAPAEEPIFKPK